MDCFASLAMTATKISVAAFRIVQCPSLDRRARQYRVPLFHPIDMIERIPRRADIRLGRMRFVMTNEVSDQGLGHAELHVRVEMRVGGIVDLRNQNLESRLGNQRMQMRRTIGVPAL